jgi:hypothetical protein
MRAARARLHSLNRRNNGSGAGPASVVGVRLRGLHAPEYLNLTRLLGRLGSFSAALETGFDALRRDHGGPAAPGVS